ncbi:hypothetical protein [Spiroplasma citri]|uniref:Uncharacterized protein n=1 Tax=Spiroplasma citri TaxID=2133 RepID=A0AAJ4EJ57_SPICI|nr:hypothetical protein [Spiroplasma citri]APE74649.1 hypothetical protein SCITRI_00756 [Spiroplasma citri]QIA66881.1 hypothetical protein GMI18_03995 [Spiroplasma citri]QIA68706.1 hypothetical protein GL298_03795 [Spiroplasma citri]QIA72117.1 hypothetical protein GL981_12625 [Spiroplasma citri]QIA73904.1 hypothetical protein GL982_10130 [Spiroplasma citri]
MGKRKYCKDCQEDGLNIPYDGYYWSFSDERYTQKEINFIVSECNWLFFLLIMLFRQSIISSKFSMWLLIISSIFSHFGSNSSP